MSIDLSPDRSLSHQNAVIELLPTFAATAISMAALATFALAGGAAPGAGEGKRPPNIVFILAGDVSADELAPYGGAIAMPNLQRLKTRNNGRPSPRPRTVKDGGSTWPTSCPRIPTPVRSARHCARCFTWRGEAEAIHPLQTIS